jgi:hypothetical protein
LNPDQDRDPDPALQVYQDQDPIRICIQSRCRVLLTKTENFFDQKLQFTYVNATEEDFTFALLGPDPDCEFGSGYRSRDPIASGSTAQSEAMLN